MTLTRPVPVQNGQLTMLFSPRSRVQVRYYNDQTQSPNSNLKSSNERLQREMYNSNVPGQAISHSVSVISLQWLSPPQRLLLVNTRERKGSGSAGERKRECFLSFPFPAFPARFNFSSSQPPRTAGIFFPRRDCRRPLRRRELPWGSGESSIVNWSLLPVHWSRKCHLSRWRGL